MPNSVRKSSAAYWNDRAVADEAYFQELSDAFYREISVIHNRAHDDIRRELASVVRNMEKHSGDGANYLYRKQQLEALKQHIDNTFIRVGGQDIRLMGDFFGGIVTESFGRSTYSVQQAAGIGFTVRRPNQQMLNSILNSQWEGRNFKDSVGWNTADVAVQAKGIIAKASLAGVNIRTMSQELSDLQQVDLWKAERLIRTETNYFAGQGEIQAYDRCGVDRYRYLATLDKRTSETCRDLDGKTFNVADAKPGVNYPPAHPWCRSTTVAHFDDETLDSMERRARDPETGKNEIVPPGMTYREWEKRFLKEEAESGIMKAPILTAEEVIDKAKRIAYELENSPQVYSVGKGEVFSHILKTQGFDGLPQVVSADEFDKLAEGQRVIYRGLSSTADMKAADMAEQFRSGELHVNSSRENNKHGRGTYGAFDEGRARTYAANDGVVFKMLLSNEARIVDAQELWKEWQDALATPPWKSDDRESWEAVIEDMGTYAAIQGYDAIRTNGFCGDDYIVILNRTKAIIKE